MERAHEVLFWVGLGEARYRPLGTYSLGMKQMAKLAQAIVGGPQLLLLDEPTNGLDPPARERMLHLIREIVAGGVCVLVSSHLLRDVEACCGEVLVLKDGHLAAQVDLEAERRANRRFLELEPVGGDGKFAEAIAALGCEWAQVNARRLKVVLAPDVEVRDLYRIAHEQGVQLRRLSCRRDSLEDIFLKAMENGNAGQ